MKINIICVRCEQWTAVTKIDGYALCEVCSLEIDREICPTCDKIKENHSLKHPNCSKPVFCNKHLPEKIG